MVGTPRLLATPQRRMGPSFENAMAPFFVPALFLIAFVFVLNVEVKVPSEFTVLRRIGQLNMVALRSTEYLHGAALLLPCSAAPFIAVSSARAWYQGLGNCVNMKRAMIE